MKGRVPLTRWIFLTIAVLVLQLSTTATYADDRSAEELAQCGIQVGKYLDRVSAYQASPRRSPKEFRELAGAYKDALRERNECLRSINMKFKDDLRAIKSKYDALKDDRSTSRALRETQRLAEISTATLSRDEAIRNLPLLPALPEKPIKR
ncbi:MAG: hypothetical protein ACO23J_05930 [Candidatus Nanopelagicaceae bacterium]